MHEEKKMERSRVLDPFVIKLKLKKLINYLIRKGIFFMFLGFNENKEN